MFCAEQSQTCVGPKLSPGWGGRPSLGRGGSSCAEPRWPRLRFIFDFTRRMDLLRFCSRRGGRGRFDSHVVAERKRQLLLLGLGRLVGAHDALDQGVADHIAFFEMAEVDALDTIEYVDGINKAGFARVRQVD